MSQKLEVKESFEWAGPISLYKTENDGARIYKGRAISARISGNKVKYAPEELKSAAKSLADHPLNINHKIPLPFDSTRQTIDNRTLDSDYNPKTKAVEVIYRVVDKKTNDLYDQGKINHLSIEGAARDKQPSTGGSEEAQGLHFNGLALVTKDVTPGDPTTNISLWETVQFYETTVDRLLGERPDLAAATNEEGKTLSQMLKDAQVVAVCKCGTEFDPTLKACPKCNEHFEVKGKLVLRSPDNEVKKDMSNKVETPKSTEKVEEAGWGAADWPNSCFAYVPKDGNPSDRKLPYKNKDGSVDIPHVRNALARLDQTQGIPPAEKEEIRTMLQNLLKKDNPDYEPSENKARVVAAKEEKDPHIEIPAVYDGIAGAMHEKKIAPEVYQELKRIATNSINKAQDLDSKINIIRDLQNSQIAEISKEVAKANEELKKVAASASTKAEVMDAVTKVDVKLSGELTETKEQVQKRIEAGELDKKATETQVKSFSETITALGQRLEAFTKKVDETMENIRKGMESFDKRVDGAVKIAETVKETIESRKALKTIPFKGTHPDALKETVEAPATPKTESTVDEAIQEAWTNKLKKRL